MLLWILGVTFESLSAKLLAFTRKNSSSKTHPKSSIVSLYIMLLGFRKSSTMILWFFSYLCQKFFIIREDAETRSIWKCEMIDMMHCDIYYYKADHFGELLPRRRRAFDTYFSALEINYFFVDELPLFFLYFLIFFTSLLLYSLLFCMQSFMLWCIISSL